MAGLSLNLDSNAPTDMKMFGLPSPDEQKIEHVRASSDRTTDTTVTSPFAETGPTINRSKTKEQFVRKKAQNSGLLWPRIRRIFREPLSEFLGVFILIMFGDGVVAQVVLSNGEKGDYQSISWGWVGCSVNMHICMLLLIVCRASVSCLASTLPVSVVHISYVFARLVIRSDHVLTASCTGRTQR